MKRLTYLENLENTLIEGNRKALKYGDGKAWDNKKIKIARSNRPRGKAIFKIWDMEWKAMFKRTEKLMDDLGIDYL